jgi:hypothetical protein
VPNINDAFPSKWLKAVDLQGHTPVVAITHVAFEVMGRSQETKAVVYFAGKAKGLKLTKTTAAAITLIAGSPLTEDWGGVRVQLYATVADFGGQTYDVVRIRPAGSGRSAPAPAPRPLPPPVDDLEIDLHDEEIPF